MGRPYLEELGRLPATYMHARTVSIDRLVAWIDRLRARPLVVVGSGGSLSACHFAARLHEANARLPARVLTPLEFVRQPSLHDSGVLLLSAGGRNPDILAAARHAALSEYREVLGLCARTDTALAAELAPVRHAAVMEFDNPAGKDGFLATNSLLLTCVLLARAYGAELPETLPAFSDHSSGEISSTAAFKQRAFVALAGGWATAAAADFESKWGEAGLGTVTILDPRNFAHGRHFGALRRADDTAIVGLATSDEKSALDRTLGVFPDAISTTCLASPLSGAAGALDLLIRVMLVTGDVATGDGVDPGRPRVPQFGRRLYHAGMGVQRTEPMAGPEDLWIKRKLSSAVWDNAPDETRAEWRRLCHVWRKGAEQTSIGAVAFDYDGTLCEADERLGPPSEKVAAALMRLIEMGVAVGVATGRGGSVLEALRSVLPESVWQRIWIGMYNGGRLQRLDDPEPEHGEVNPEIVRASEMLSASPVLSRLARFSLQPGQVCVRPAVPLPDALLLRFVKEELVCSGLAVDVRASGHTVDVVSREVTKLSVVKRLQEHLAPGAAVMTIGDQGQSGGNDERFLGHPLGLSVEYASSRFDACWNVAPPGARRTVALLGYLAAVRSTGTGVYWSPKPVNAGSRRTSRK